MRKNEKITALYERLSRDDFGKDDDQQRESNSISNQKAMLEEFAARQGFTNIVHFTDDGISGTCFDRPGFLAMMKEVEAGNVEYLCIKDMSRMGRDYLKVGQIMEILRQRGVRLIAINDGVDSARGDDDFTPFRNIMNEYYARDTSRKIRSTFQSKGKSGKHLTGTVIYGYLWNEARDQWLVDPEAAEVVKRIFSMTIDGYGPYQIASKLKSEKVLIPSAYLAQHGEGVNKNKTFKDVYDWGSSTICNILEKREYLGHTINFKTRKHFKDKKSHYVPEDEFTQFLLLIPVVFINFKYYRMGFKTLFHGSPNMDSLIAIGSSAAIVYGIYAIYKIGIGFGHGDMATVHSFMTDLYFESAGMILTLITLGKTLEARAKGKTSDAITKLMNLVPKTATVERDGQEIQVPVEDVQLGETLIVKAGESVPVDGIVIEGFSSVDESALTGESIPVEKHIGDKVIGATTSKSGYFKIN